jgi:hypothetical protein
MLVFYRIRGEREALVHMKSGSIVVGGAMAQVNAYTNWAQKVTQCSNPHCREKFSDDQRFCLSQSKLP